MHNPNIERRVGSRARVDLPVSTYIDGFWHACRAVDLSPSGMIVERTKSLAERLVSQTNAVELRMVGARPIRMRVRTVWTDGRYCAVRFVLMSDADRLTIAEHLDSLERGGQSLH